MTKRAKRNLLKLTTLLTVLSMLFCSGTTAIAVDSFMNRVLLAQQTFGDYTPEDGVTVTLSGLLPVGGSAEVLPYDADGEDVLHAYDITIFDQDGGEFQPAGDAPIAVSVKSDKIEAALDGGDTLSVTHIDDSGSESEVALTAADDDEALFDAESFSVYVIKTHDADDTIATPRKTFYFLSNIYQEYSPQTKNDYHGYYVSSLYEFLNKAGDMVSVQIVKNGESLQPIVIPENFDWGYFYGWYIVNLDFAKSAAATAADLNKDVSEIQSVSDLTRFVYKWDDHPQAVDTRTPITVGDTDEDVFVAPLYTNYRFVTFHESERVDGQPSNIVTRKLVALGDNRSADIQISDVTAISPDPQKLVFYGWSYEAVENGNVVTKNVQTRRATGDEIESSIVVTDANVEAGGSIDMYPIFKEARWITFVHGQTGWNAKYVGAMFAYLYDPEDPDPATLTQLPSTTRPGYIFDGWYTGHMDGDTIVYDEDGQVTLPMSYENEEGNSAVVASDQKKVICTTENAKGEKLETFTQKGRIYLRDALTLYAKWRPANTADYKVVLWKQRVTDDKNAADSAKTYDYESYTLMENEASGTKILNSIRYQEERFEQQSFEGFHYSRTEVVVGKNAYTGDEAKEEGVVSSDGSTVVNVYYDRDLMTVQFDFNGYSQYTPDPNGSYVLINGTYYNINNYDSITTTNGSVYYLTQSGSTAPYSGTIYYRSGKTYRTATSPIYNQPYYYYYRSGFSGNYSQLTWNTYTGERYSVDSAQTLTWTGLYQQSFEQNGYSWDDVSSYVWQGVESDGTTRTQTMLVGFTQKNTPYVLTATNTNPTYQIIHCKQMLNGAYSNTDTAYYNTAYSRNSSSNFTFSNKFDGFTVAKYSRSFSSSASGATDIKEDQTVNISLPFYVYHTRNTYPLTFGDYYPDGSDRVIEEQIPFEASLSEYANLVPPERTYYTFGGWYEDASCTKEFRFADEFMPAAPKKVYAKWDYKYYFVEIDPNGGVMEDQLEFAQYTGAESAAKHSTYTWVQYGGNIAEYSNIERNFVPSGNGEYVYVNVKFAPSFEEAASKNWDYSLSSRYRAAFYCRSDELNTVYEQHFDGLEYNGTPLLTKDGFLNYCVDNTTHYRKAEGREGYALVAWYKVNDDGTTSNEIYNFGDAVTAPTRIRAVWRTSGTYYLEYDPYDERYDIGDEQYSVQNEAGEWITVSNEIQHDPEHPLSADSSQDGRETADHYIDGSKTVILKAPSYIPERYVFRGWELLDRDGLRTGIYYDPADDYIIDSVYADSNGRIRFKAAYEPEQETVRRTDVTTLTLDANGGYTVKRDLDVYEDYVYVDLIEKQVRFTKQLNNIDVNLHDYYNNFGHSNGYMLLGWDESPNPENFIPKYAADAVVGVDSTDQNNTLYAAWEAMYYLTLENFSTDYDITFTLSFSDYDGAVYSGNTNTVVSTFERELFSAERPADDPIQVAKNSQGNFTVTLGKATKTADGSAVPTQIKLVLPEGAGARYTVTGNIAYANNGQEMTATANRNDTLSIYNSGGASEQISYGTYPTGTNWMGNLTYSTGWHNLNNQSTQEYTVNGSMKLGKEGQTVAFYTESPDTVSVYLESWAYNTGTKQWEQVHPGKGPDATLSFGDYDNLGGNVITDGTTGITNLEIIKNSAYSFSVNQSYTNREQYKFIGWYAEPQAAPDAVSLDGMTKDFGASTVTGISIPNEKVTVYYALYVPYTNGTLTLNHEERKESIGYAKKIYISANYMGEIETNEAVTSITNVSEYVDKAHATVALSVQEPETEAEQNEKITITLKAMAGYGCTYNTTYEGPRQLTTGSRDESSATRVFYNPSETDESQPHEIKYYYTYTIEKTIGEMYTDSETVKGLKLLGRIDYYSDFKRNYEFVYNYLFRDGTTRRKYVVTGETAEHSTLEAFQRFVLEKAPYISNFGEDFAWNISSIQVSNLNDKGKIIASMDSVQPKNATAIVTAKSYGSNVEVKWRIDVGTSFPDDDTRRPVAPTVSNGKRFSHWEITDTHTGKLIGRCYYPSFTFAVWSDYTITPVYIDMPESGEYERVFPSADETYVTLNYLDSTRNQWVTLDENGSYDSESLEYHDNLINDFDITFIDKGNQMNTDADRYKLGLLFEVLGSVDADKPGDYTFPADDAAHLKNRQTAVNALTKASHTQKTGKLTKNEQPLYYYSKIDPTDLSQNNRIDYYRGLDNLLTQDGSVNPNATYMFRVYAYMVVDGETHFSNSVDLQLYPLSQKTYG